MCGRWTLTVEKDVLEGFFDAKYPSKPYKPRYNIAPKQEIPVITNKNPDEFKVSRWGISKSHFVINSRAETLEKKFKQQIKNRCLIPADGFYEWKKTHYGKLPYRCVLSSGELFAFAGIYDKTGFSIITVPPNKEIGKIHNRMPAILTDDTWLSDPDKTVLKPYRGDMEVYRVSKLVNNPRNDSPDVTREITTLDDF